jgi:hypothetical protein
MSTTETTKQRWGLEGQSRCRNAAKDNHLQKLEKHDII